MPNTIRDICQKHLKINPFFVINGNNVIILYHVAMICAYFTECCTLYKLIAEAYVKNIAQMSINSRREIQIGENKI